MKPIQKLNKEIFSEKIKYVSLGTLSKKIIDFIIEHKPELKKYLSTKNDILFWANRISHTEKHKNDFFYENEYETCFESIPDIIHNPDYISVHPQNNSLSFIKDFSEHILVAVRVSIDGKLSYRTMYPISDAQLSDYLKKNLAWEYKKET